MTSGRPLPPETIATIVAGLRAGAPVKALAADAECTTQTVYNIRCRYRLPMRVVVPHTPPPPPPPAEPVGPRPPALCPSLFHHLPARFRGRAINDAAARSMAPEAWLVQVVELYLWERAHEMRETLAGNPRPAWGPTR